jgi:plastocyanin
MNTPSIKLISALFLASGFACGGEPPEADRPKKPKPPVAPVDTKAPTPKEDPKTPASTPAANTAEGYQVIAITDKGSIKGTVKWSGDIPKLPDLPVTKDNDTCGTQKTNPRLVIDAGSKGVANAVISLENITQGADLVPKDGVVDQKACDYIPHVQIVPKGSSIKALNSDPILHNVHTYLGEESVFNLAMPMQGIGFDKPLKKAGVMSIKCDAGHNWMSGYIVVVEHPYYALSDAQGNFSIENIPPGKYTVKLWHEGWETTINGDTITYADPVTLTKEIEVAKDQAADASFELPKK